MPRLTSYSRAALVACALHSCSVPKHPVVAPTFGRRGEEGGEEEGGEEGQTPENEHMDEVAADDTRNNEAGEKRWAFDFSVPFHFGVAAPFPAAIPAVQKQPEAVVGGAAQHARKRTRAQL